VIDLNEPFKPGSHTLLLFAVFALLCELCVNLTCMIHHFLFHAKLAKTRKDRKDCFASFHPAFSLSLFAF
jgi:hypothetical protein